MKNIAELINKSFTLIAPCWPLKNIIAVNPLQGFEDLAIEEALKTGDLYFRSSELPEPLNVINRETIKWLQLFFDTGQATISMPGKKQGLYQAWRKLAVYDKNLHANTSENQQWLKNLGDNPEKIMAECLLKLGIASDKQQQFLILLLTTLPGWSSYIKYCTQWQQDSDDYSITQADYLAIRLVVTWLLWPEAKTLLTWHESIRRAESTPNILVEVQKVENNYRYPLLKKLAAQPVLPTAIPEAQFIFCIDVRSEPFRRALEKTGDYQTFGFAGFFGVPVKITDVISHESYASCPVLISPKHNVKESPSSIKACQAAHKNYERNKLLKKIYQSLKYTFITPFLLLEALGLLSGFWMAIRSFSPRLAQFIKTMFAKDKSTILDIQPSLTDISLEEQAAYAESALRMIGLVNNFSSVIVLCGHGSTTVNNAYATALDCGACGGRHGASNARILSAILNSLNVRKCLINKGIVIPEKTLFIAAEHNTTTDEVQLYTYEELPVIQKIKTDLESARRINTAVRINKLEIYKNPRHSIRQTLSRSQDWAQVRPEWGLACNSAFIVAPRDITSSVDLDGRCFLHSYDYKIDMNGKLLTTILTAPMIVAQWINAQYFFSTFDNVAYGGGSKITQNITGKMGVMQGNSSDLMTGLPLQSVNMTDTKRYHEMQRLLTVVYAPRHMIDPIIAAENILQKLLGNGWIQLACIEPDSRQIYLLQRNFSWEILS